MVAARVLVDHSGEVAPHDREPGARFEHTPDLRRLGKTEADAKRVFQLPRRSLYERLDIVEASAADTGDALMRDEVDEARGRGIDPLQPLRRRPSVVSRA